MMKIEYLEIKPGVTARPILLKGDYKMNYKETLEYLAHCRGFSLGQMERDELDVIRTQALVIIAQSLENIATALEPGIKNNQEKE